MLEARLAEAQCPSNLRTMPYSVNTSPLVDVLEHGKDVTDRPKGPMGSIEVPSFQPGVASKRFFQGSALATALLGALLLQL